MKKLAILLATLVAANAHAAILNVDRTDDTAAATACTAAANDCSLRGALITANGNGVDDVINVPAGIYTISLPVPCDDSNEGGDLDIAGNVTVQGAGAATTIIDANDVDRVFDVVGIMGPSGPVEGPTVVINDLTVRDGTAYESFEVCDVGGNGGGIRVGPTGSFLFPRADLTLNRVVVTANEADEGGGIYVTASNIMRADESTIDSNHAHFDGGGVFIAAVPTEGLIENTTVSNNTAGGPFGVSVFDGDGGGVRADGIFTAVNSTISGNTATAGDSGSNGGGIFIGQSGGVDLRNVTVTDNTADGDADGNGDGGGVYVQVLQTPSGTQLTLRNTIVAGNRDNSPAGNDFPDCALGSLSAFLASEGFNLIGDETGCDGKFGGNDQFGNAGSPINPRLDPLADYGGPTETHQLQLLSPAVDMGNPAGCFSNDANSAPQLTRDQRDFTRPVDGDGDGTVRCDVGAFERPGCGNGVVDSGEECDDGNLVDGDGCSADCRLEPACGDGTLNPGEECDDGNNVDGDGCSANCTNEVIPGCGDGIVQAGEGCDDGNLVDGDGCSSNCVLESCGDGIVQSGEECDDGNDVNTDACLNTCRDASCGDGFLESNVEACDDGNKVGGDGCSSSCKLENIFLLLGDGGCVLVGGDSHASGAGVLILASGLLGVCLFWVRRISRKNP